MELVAGQSYGLESYRQFYLELLRKNPPRFLTPEEHETFFSLVPRTCVDAVIVSSDYKSVLLARRDIPPEYQIGRWTLPGGGIQYGELLVEAVKRIAKRETGLDIRVERFIGVYDDPLNDVMFWTRENGWQVAHDPKTLRHSIVHEYIAQAEGGTLTGSPEGREVRFFGFDALPDNIGFHHKRVLDDYEKLFRSL